jgi:3-deoxy-D-manno-octulosonic-acid transferase
VSAGETRAAAPLIARIEREQPGVPILLTAMTATGRETGQQLYGHRVHRAFLPYDLPFAVDRFLTRFAPRVGLLMETELWPNLVIRSATRGVPVYLVNARLSQRSADGYGRMGAFAHDAFGALAGVAAQGDADAQRLRTLGANAVRVTGNIKFDADVPEAQRVLGKALRARFGASRPVFIAAATREGEEALLLDALARAPLSQNALTLIVPRHPQRFDAVAELLARRGLGFVRRSGNVDVPPDTHFVLGDSMGEMYAYYSAADVAFVGGSLIPLGGQNMIEPLAVGVPALFGPHTFNFTDAAANAVAAGAALRVDSADDLVSAVRGLLEDPARRATMQAAGQRFLVDHRGATDRLWSWLAPRIAGAAARMTAP